VIEYVWEQVLALGGYLRANFDPFTDTLDILAVAFAIYWLLLLIKGTRAVQMLVGLLLLIGVNAASQRFQFQTLSWIMDHFLSSGVLILIILFQHDIRRGLARVGRGFFPSVRAHEESAILEEIVRASRTLAEKRVGALIVLERETSLDDQFETGTALDAAVTKELLTSIFLPYSPLHDGAVVIQGGRVAHAGCVLPLTLRQDLPEGMGTRHRAAFGITEETDAVVVVVSEETGRISVVAGGDLVSGLDAPELRAVLRDLMSGARRDLRAAPAEAKEAPAPAPAPSASSEASAEADARTIG
jgi:uncharacterized protein (TIGR00159 family)